MDDLISRQAAITLPVMPKEYRKYQTFNLDDAYEQGWDDLQKCIEALPSAQPECPFEIQDILDYLDTVLHPIISPEYWNVYSELYDMISTLPSAEPFSQKEKLKMRVKSENLFPDLPQNIKDKNTEIAKAYQEGYEQGKKDAERRGRWINGNEGIWNAVILPKCSICGETFYEMNVNINGEYPYNYCPNCGARMEAE